MLIHIMYPGNTYDYVREFKLNNLIKYGQIVKFRRHYGWVSVGTEPVRAENRTNPYIGIEKRSPVVTFATQREELFQARSADRH